MQAMAVPVPQERVEDAIDALVAEPVDQLPSRALGDDLIALRRHIDRLEAEFVRRLQRFDERNGAREDGLSVRAGSHVPLRGGGAAAPGS